MDPGVEGDPREMTDPRGMTGPMAVDLRRARGMTGPMAADLRRAKREVVEEDDPRNLPAHPRYVVVVVYHVTIVAIGHRLLKKFGPFVLCSVLRTAGSSII